MVRRGYIACGLRIRSELVLPELHEDECELGAPDVEIRLLSSNAGMSGLAACSDRSTLEADRFELVIGGLASYEVRNGKLVTIGLASGAAERDIRLYLYASVWAALCHQRGLLPLHGSGVKTRHGIVAFLGEQGTGKSSMAAAMESLGHELSNDDVIVLREGGSAKLEAWPFIRRSKLRADSMEAIGSTPAEAETVHVSSEKWWVIPKRTAPMRPAPLHRILVLERSDAGSRPVIEKLEGAQAIEALIKHTFHLDLLSVPSEHQRHLMMCSALLRQCEIYRLRRPFELASLTEIASLVAAHADA